MHNNIETKLLQAPKPWVKVLINTIVLLIIFIPALTQINWQGLNHNAFEVVQQILMGFVSPDIGFLVEQGEGGLIFLMIQTLAIGFLGTLIGAVISLPLAFMASSNITNKTMSVIFSLIITIIRTFPLFVYAVIFIKILGPGPSCGVLTIAITSIGMLSKMFIEAIEDIDPQLLKAADSLGYNLWQKCRYVVFEQLKSNFISTTIYRLDINIKNSTALGLVGAGGIGTAINFSVAANNWAKFGMIMILLIVIVLIIDYLSTKIRKKLV